MNDDEVLVKGAARTIAFTRRQDGSMPARTFWNSKVLPEKDKCALELAMNLMADTGVIRNTERFKLVGDGIFEFKAYQIRLGCFWDKHCRGVLRLTHGFVKKKNKWPPKELKLAVLIQQEHTARHQKGGKK